MKIVEQRGALAGAVVVDAEDEVLAVTSNGGVIRTRVDTVNPTGRDTMGVKLMNLKDGDSVLLVARNAEMSADEDDVSDTEDGVDAQVSAPEPQVDGGESTEIVDEGGA